MLRKREKTFGPGRPVPLDGNAKARIQAYARGKSNKLKRPGQHRGPITRAFAEVLKALLWDFHNSRDGRCFPSYEAIAAKAECCRDTVYEALRALEFAGVLTWANRIVRIRVRERDLFGKWTFRSRVMRTSNGYTFRDPKAAESRPNGGFSSKSENPPGTLNQEIQILKSVRAEQNAAVGSLSAGLEAALAGLEAAFEERLLGNRSGPPVPAS